MADLFWHGCAVPDDLLYDVALNVWVRLQDDCAVLGMTDVAQTMGGRMVPVSWKRTSRTYARGKSLAVLESAKWAGPFPTPGLCDRRRAARLPAGAHGTGKTRACPPTFRTQAGHLGRASAPLDGHEPLTVPVTVGVGPAGRAAARRGA